MASGQNCLLDILPVELRSQIWNYVLEKDISVQVERKSTWNDSAEIPLHGAFRRDPRYIRNRRQRDARHVLYRRDPGIGGTTWSDDVEEAFLKGALVCPFCKYMADIE